MPGASSHNAAQAQSGKIALDGIFFQFHDRSGIARVWSSLLKEWSQTPFGSQIVVLDREGSAPKYRGIGKYLPIKSYSSRIAGAESCLLEAACRFVKADLFISTFVTAPLETPSVYMVHDLIPELFAEDDKVWTREKRYCTNNACAYITISQNTTSDLHEIYPLSRARPLRMVSNAVEKVFRPAEKHAIERFKETYGITQPYFLTVGRRARHKNAELFFSAFSRLPDRENFSMVCCGGEEKSEQSLATLVQGTQIHHLRLSDEELNCAYGGAIALVYPSRYEGFGLPIVEALAVGCPVITCKNSSIPEVAGNAVVYVGEQDVDSMVEALTAIRTDSVRQPMIQAGFQQAQKFSWQRTAHDVASFLSEAAIFCNDHRHSVSAQRWREFRQYQSRTMANEERLAELEAIWLKTMEQEERAV